MGKPSAEELAQRAFDLGVLDERQLQEVWAYFGSRTVGVDQFVKFLLRREFLTNYQIERLRKDERTGFFFGEYKVLYLVGSGTFARVYRAVHRSTGQVVAVKVLRKRYSDNTTQYSQFVREGRLGCSLRHPNIVPIFEVFSRDKTHFLVMDFVEGQNLRDFVKIRKLVEPKEATRLMIGIVQGMRYAFEHGLTHRDLKMNNVLVSSQRQAKLVDFGLAAVDHNLADEALADLPNTRTIDYAALERATGVRKDDTRSDIYFLGCIYYHMLTGRPPLREVKDRVQRLSKNRFLEVKPIRKVDPMIPDSVALVVNKSLNLDPQRRYQSPGNMLTDLEIALKRLGETSQKDLQRAAPGGSRPIQGQQNRSRHTAATEPPQKQPSVMVVESNQQMQDIFRQGLKRAGWRVLLTIDPARALERFQVEPQGAADCVVLNAQELGKSALDVFNQFGEDAKTDYFPAVLLLDENQHHWKGRAKTADHRVVLPMPITMKQLRATLAKLVTAAASEK